MRTVQVPDAVKEIVDRFVATGAAASEADFLDQAVRCYVAAQQDENALITAVRAGQADIQAGNFSTVDGVESRAAFWNGVMDEAASKVAEMRASGVGTKS